MQTFKAEAQCSNWENEVCISYCSDVWDGAGERLACFDASEYTIDHPAQLFSCFNNSLEQVAPYSDPMFPNIKNRPVIPQFLLCLPSGLCNASLKLFSVTGQGNSVNETLILNYPEVFLGVNRSTPCESCAIPNSYCSLPHGQYSNLIGKYKLQMSYICCGDPIPRSFTLYYEIVDAASASDITLKYLATNQIETINGDINLDGLLSNSVSSPGPQLGPFSAGVRVSSVGAGVTQYKVSLYRISCGNPGSGATLVNSTTIPYAGNQTIDYRFLDIPNWSTIYVAGGCYKVVVEVTSICGAFSQTGFFTITTQCVFCLDDPNEITDRSRSNVGSPNFEVYPNPSDGTINIASKIGIREVLISNTDGKIISQTNFETLDTFAFQSDIGQAGVYFLKIQTIDGLTFTKKIIILN